MMWLRRLICRLDEHKPWYIPGGWFCWRCGVGELFYPNGDVRRVQYPAKALRARKKGR